MSEFKPKIVLGVVLAIVIATGLAAVSFSLAPQLAGGSAHSSTYNTSQTTTTGIVQSSQTGISGPSVLIVQLTDPPIVPAGTTALNLTYTSINLLVAEPTVTVTTSGSTTTTIKTQSGVVSPQTVTITPSKGPATVNLLKLQNISETLGSASLPSGSTIYSITFTVSSITITIGGTTSAVTLATGGSTLLVTLAKPAVLQGTNAVLLDLNPTVVNTTSGYQMIPSSIGIIRPQAEISGQSSQIGHEDKVTDQDQQDIHNQAGQVTANLETLAVSGSLTTITVRISNTGTTPVHLVGIDIHGNFTVQGPSCTTSTSTTTTSDGDHQGFNPFNHCGFPFSFPELLLMPNATASAQTSTTTTSTSTTTTASSCITSTLDTLHMNVNVGRDIADNGFTIGAGQCVNLTFSGTITFGNHGVLVPSTAPGQQYIVHIVASDNAQMTLNCTLPLSATSCTVANTQDY